jgi:hypothetical protein
VIIGFVGDGWLPVHDCVEIVRNGHDTCIVVDPRPYLHRPPSRIKVDFANSHWINVLGIARLALSDASTCQALLTTLDDRWAENWYDMPFIEF